MSVQSEVPEDGGMWGTSLHLGLRRVQKGTWSQDNMQCMGQASSWLSADSG